MDEPPEARVEEQRAGRRARDPYAPPAPETQADGNIVRVWFGTWISYWLTSRLNGFIGKHISVHTRDC